MGTVDLNGSGSSARKWGGVVSWKETVGGPIFSIWNYLNEWIFRIKQEEMEEQVQESKIVLQASDFLFLK